MRQPIAYIKSKYGIHHLNDENHHILTTPGGVVTSPCCRRCGSRKLPLIMALCLDCRDGVTKRDPDLKVKDREIKNVIAGIIKTGNNLLCIIARNGDEDLFCRYSESLLASPNMLRGMLDAGRFNDARVIEYDALVHARVCRDVTGQVMDDGIVWTQIEFGSGEGENPHHYIAWVWKE